MKRAVFIICAFMFCFAVNVFAAGLKTYKNTDLNFKVKYPSDWQVEEISGMIVFISPLEDAKDNYREYVSVGSEDISAYPIPLGDYVEFSFENWLRQTADLTLKEKRETQVDGKDAIYIICEEKETRYKQYYIMHDSRAYVLTYAASVKDFDRYLDRAEALIRSIKISG